MASFDDVFRTYCKWKGLESTDANAQAANATFRQSMTDFESSHGQLDHYSIFLIVGAGVAITERGVLYFVDPAELGREDVEKLILKAKSLYRIEQSTLGTNDLRLCAEDVYFVINGLYAVQEATNGLSDATVKNLQIDRAVAIHQEELVLANECWKRCATKTVLMRYFEGTLIGLVPLIIVGFMLYYFVGFILKANTLSATATLRTLNLEVLGAFIAAGMGAVVSVMTRLSSGRLTLDVTAGTTITRVLGGVRPLLGALMGLVVFAFIKSGILPIAMPDVASAPEKTAFFMLAVAFVAGFSERLVQDLLSVAETDPRFGAGVRPPVAPGGGAAGAPAVPETAVPGAGSAGTAN